MRLQLIILTFLLFQTSAFAQNPEISHHHKRQFRAAWMATVRNLDWPSKPGLSNRRLKKEYIKQLDQLHDLGMNAVIVQIRPSGDALYPTTLAPWSEFLSGKQGEAPANSFDPVAFMIEEAHQRSMEFHAWFNPYRGIRNYQQAMLATNHIYHQHPEWFVFYGKDAYIDPGMIPARKYLVQIIAEVVGRYDIDAVHFDDYYYPYRLKGLEFPDSLSFAQYGAGYNAESKGDWRRENVNQLVEELYDTINHLKPWVQFGISPFGVWRNKSRDARGSDTQTKQTNYDDLYGDALTWLQNGWLDYIIPQSYEYLGRDIMDYRVVARWWEENRFGINYYIGQSPYRLDDPNRGKPWVNGNEIVRQLYFNDSIPGLQGSAFFRSTTFLDNPLGLNDSIRNRFYKFPALPPVSSHDRDRDCEVKITKVEYHLKKKKMLLGLQVDNPDFARFYVLYKNSDITKPEHILLITSQTELRVKLRPDLDLSQMYITVVDRYRHESSPYKIVSP